MSPLENQILSLFNFVGSLICHQLQDRTLWIGGYYLPVCARDTGAYLGLFLGYLLLPFRRKEAKGPPNLWMTLMMIVPMIVDAGTQLVGLRTSTNELRLITGLLFGTALAPMLVYLLSLAPSSRKVPILRNFLPKTVELDNRDAWLNNWAFVVGAFLVVASFLTIDSVVGSVNPISYWSLSSLIFVSVILHVFLLPAFLVVLFLPAKPSLVKRNTYEAQ